MFNRKNQKKTVNKITAVVLLLTMGCINAQPLNTAVQVAVNTNKAAAQAQVRIDKLSTQTDNLVGQYRQVLNEIESLRAYNKQLEAVVSDQRVQVESMNKQMTTLEQTNRGIVPMIIEMVDALGQLVEADLPFKKEERLERVSKLEDLLGKSDLTTAELYRKVTEAYGIELDYGSSAESYQGELPDGKKVDFLRVGRNILVYQTFNQEVSGWWNPKTQKFEEIDRRYNDEIKEALRIASKKASPNLVGLPVLGAQQAGGQ